MPKAIIIGASSGIGKELAKLLAREGYEVGITGRRLELLEELHQEIGSAAYVKQLDVSHAAESMERLQALIAEMGGLDLMVIGAGTGHLNPEFAWEKERDTIDVNVYGFVAAGSVAAQYFMKQGSGHLVGHSYIMALRGGADACAYAASKAFISNYLEGMRKTFFKRKLPITVTEIRPGFVDTAMAKGDGKFWVASPAKAAEQMVGVIKSKKKKAYVTRRWALIGWLLRWMPDWLFYRI